MKYTTRLFLGFASIFLLVSVLITVIVFMLNNQNQEISSLVEDRYEKIKLLNHIRVNVKGIDKDLNIYIHSKGNQRKKSLQRIHESMMNIDEDLRTLNGIIKIKDAKVQLSNINSQIKSYQLTVERIVYLADDTPKVSSLSITANEQYDQIISTSEKLITIQERIMEDTLISTKASYSLYVKISLSIIMLALLLSIGISRGVINNIKHRFQSIRNVMNSIHYGSENLPRLKVIAKDEIGEIAYAYNKMAEALEEHERIERLYTEEIEEQNWLSMKLADLSMLSQEAIDLQALGEKYIREIVPLVGASHGALYVKKNDHQTHYLTKVSVYAEQIEKSSTIGKENIYLGEGLVGQCAKDGRPIHIHHIPPNYISISSGLGETAPKAILIVPIILDGAILGVLELATVNEFTELHEKLLFQATVQLGITIYRINQQMQVRELLGEAQALNEELQSQSEELHIQQEELRAMNEELELLYKNSEQKTKDLEVTKQELEEKTRLVQLGSKYKSEFLATISHELRTPLNSLLILAQILQENKENNLSDKQKEYASTIYSAGKDLLYLINDILDLAKIESGKVDVQVGAMEIADILEYTRQQFEPLAEQKGIKLLIRSSHGIPATVSTDETKVFQILKNLLSNAIKFTEKGSVILQVDSSLDEVNEQEFILFKVSDTGIGISAENKKLIFNAFQQADGTTSRKYGGTGLGLSISKELAHILGGYITVESVIGQGSTFTFFLPTQESQGVVLINEVASSMEEECLLHVSNPLPKKKIVVAKELEGKNILIVDDDMRNIFSLTTALESVGMTVSFAENGLEGIQVLENNIKIDIVLMDLMMPEMDGFRAIKEIRKNNKYNDLPIIVLTAKAMMDDRDKCMDAGASDYITKPIIFEELITSLKKWL